MKTTKRTNGPEKSCLVECSCGFQVWPGDICTGCGNDIAKQENLLVLETVNPPILDRPNSPNVQVSMYPGSQGGRF
jgi:hypothetical protein